MIRAESLAWISVFLATVSIAATGALGWRINARGESEDVKLQNTSDDNKPKRLPSEAKLEPDFEKMLSDVLSRIKKLEEEQELSLRDVSTIRFDAFDDIGGKQSFSSAFLNSQGEGVVITGINGRNESRTYAKPIENGSSFFKLSAEETEAIEKAMRSISKLE